MDVDSLTDSFFTIKKINFESRTHGVITGILTLTLQSNTFSGLFVGQNLITLESVDSTNSYLKKILLKSEPLPEGTVVLAVEQIAGRGQLGACWYSESGKNLTCSILLSPTFLLVEKQFELNKAISLAINDVLSRHLGPSAKIKWPNDSYLDEQKIGGILIENIIHGHLLKHAIIGFALNVNQSEFPSLKNATSFKNRMSKEYDLMSLLGEVCAAIETRYLQLKAGEYTAIDADYLNKLYLLGESNKYRMNGKLRQGVICGVSAEGYLEVKAENQVQQYRLKEIEFIGN